MLFVSIVILQATMIRRKWKDGHIKAPPHAMCALQEKDQMEADSFAVPNVKILIIAGT